MGWIDKLKNLFKKKDEKEEFPCHLQPPLPKNLLIYPSENRIVNGMDNTILNSIHIDKEVLAFDRIVIETKELNSILKDLMYSINSYENKKELNDEISLKIKNATMHGLELKNLLGILEEQYYNLLINNLKKMKKDVKSLIGNLESDKNRFIDLETELAKLVVYDYRLNSERNLNYEHEIKEEIKNNDLRNDIEKLNEMLIIIPELGEKIEHEDIIEDARILLQ
ncbi:hypothetical protein J4440_00700 [Candidatus Woesearchaeota archaeon]|nr:hypothetical protein [Candidatus Woesearchaeota archaeon]